MSEAWERAELDLATRRDLYAGAPIIRVAQDSLEFWRWYSCTIQPQSPPHLVPIADAPSYTAEQREHPFALWFSGGVESTYTLSKISHLKPDLLSIDDYRQFKGPDRSIGQIHFICAVIAAALGYRVCYMGIERNDLLMTAAPKHRGFIERSPAFIDQWNRHCPDRQIHSVCRDMYKEEVLLELQKTGYRITGTCDNCKDGTWCGHCFKCFEAFYTAKAVGIDLGIQLDGEGCARYYKEYERYISSGFRDNYNNAYQHFVRLQITYHLRIDPARDCSAPSNFLEEDRRARR